MLNRTTAEHKHVGRENSELQLNLAGLVLEGLAICNPRVQVANLISFEAVNFGLLADIAHFN